MPKYEGPFGGAIDILAEECSELIKELMKANRFGLAGISAYKGSKPRKNTVQEIGDVLWAIEFYCSQHNVSGKEITIAKINKAERVKELFGVEL